MDTTDKKLLNALQFNFPLTVTPYKSLGKKLGCTEKGICERIGALKSAGIVRQISPIFDSSQIGYRSTLAAFKVPVRAIEKTAALLSAQPGVSHNYLREGAFNIWFTLTLPHNRSLESEIGRLAKKAEISDWLYLPSTRTFKVNFRLDMSGKEGTPAPAPKKMSDKQGKEFVRPRIKPAFIREVQHDLPLVPRPWAGAAKKLHITETELIGTLKQCIKATMIRRVAAVLRQNKAGFTSNTMVAWAPAPGQTEGLGCYAAAQSAVSHCYERPARPGWPFTLYTMIHAMNDTHATAVIADIVRATGVTRFKPLHTLKEFKKIRVRYFDQKTPTKKSAK